MKYTLNSRAKQRYAQSEAPLKRHYDANIAPFVLVFSSRKIENFIEDPYSNKYETIPDNNEKVDRDKVRTSKKPEYSCCNTGLKQSEFTDLTLFYDPNSRNPLGES